MLKVKCLLKYHHIQRNRGIWCATIQALLPISRWWSHQKEKRWRGRGQKYNPRQTKYNTNTYTNTKKIQTEIQPKANKMLPQIICWSGQLHNCYTWWPKCLKHVDIWTRAFNIWWNAQLHAGNMMPVLDTWWPKCLKHVDIWTKTY